MTGAAGFIGSHLVERLLALGQEVVGLDDLSTGRRSNLSALARGLPEATSRFRLELGDVRDLAAVRAAARGCELVLHQAGLGSVPRSFAEPARSLGVNAEGTWTVLAGARAEGARRVVFASSSSVYGDLLEAPQREERTGRALSPYAASKQVAELAAAGFARGLGFECVALRYFNVFGPRQDPEGPYAAVIPRWIAALLAGAAPRLEGDGLQTRDFTPVEAVVRANLLAASRPLPGPWNVFNVGTGRETSLLALLAELRRLQAERRSAGHASLPEPSAELERAPARPGDRRASRADLERIRRVLGYEPPRELVTGLRATLVAALGERHGEPLGQGRAPRPEERIDSSGRDA